MIPDRNKSELTHKVTEATSQWLDNHGFKPVETEVQVSNSWIADLAGAIDPTQTELIDMRFVPRPPRYEYGGKKNDTYRERREVWEANFKPWFRQMTCLVEVKTSRGDFLNDKKWKATPPTDIAFIAMPSGMMKTTEWPDGWGVIELRGDLAVKMRNPVPRVATAEEQLKVIYSIAIRRDHRTRYAQDREQQKEQRIEQAEHRLNHRIDCVIDAVRDIVAGKFRRSGEQITSVEQVLIHHGLRKVRPHSLERLSEILGIAAQKDSACIQK